MASKRSARGKKSKQTPKFDLNDERIPKIIGVLCIFLAIYLSIAFLSYLYTWKLDQDKVLMNSWNMIFAGDLSVSNWLGRLGAVISNMFFYWGFGLPSVFFIAIFAKLGVDLIRRVSLRDWFTMVQNGFLLMAICSLILEFIFRNSEFTWGGAFGESTYIWLSSFIGNIGLFILLIFGFITASVWYLNPDFEQLEYSTPMGNFKVPDLLRETLLSFKSNNESSSTARQTRDTDSDDEIYNEKPNPLRPSNDNRQRSISKTDDANEAQANSDLEFELPEASLAKSPRSKEPVLTQFEINDVQGIKVEDEEEGKVVPFTEVKKEADADILPIQEQNSNHVEPYDPTLDLSKYIPPTLELLEQYEAQNVEVDRAELETNKDQIIKTLLDYKIEITKIRATIGPTVTLYEIIPAPGVKISKIKNLEDDIALSLAALGIRIIAPIPGKGTIGIEVPNKKPQIVSLREVLQSDKYTKAKMDLPIALGKTISNEVFVADLAKMPHLLIAGATGQGKSVGINTVLMSLLYKKHPSQVKLVLIDPKKVELFPYASLFKHFLAYLPNEDEPIVTDTAKVVMTLNSLCIEMDARYDLLKKARARNLNEYNEKFTSRRLNPNDGHKFLPFIVLVIDEFADLIMTAGKEVEMPIARLAQLARAIGIHLIIATQRPSVNIITGIIKANFPARLAFKVTSKIDSRTILDQGGADQLIGRGDMLLSIGSNTVRLQCAFVDTPEVERIIDHIGDQQGFPEPFYLPEYVSDEDSNGKGELKFSDLDDNFEEAALLTVGNQHGSTSMIQRKLQLGYNRAGRIMDQMESLGIVGPAKGSKPREVLFFSEQELLDFMVRLKERG